MFEVRGGVRGMRFEMRMNGMIVVYAAGVYGRIVDIRYVSY
jgi:hypothetical protein